MNKTVFGLKVSAVTRFGLKYIKKSPFFDAGWYRSFYGLDDREDAARHYLYEGWKLGFDPSGRFSTRGYLQHYQDVFKSGMNPLLHYEKYGKYEDRQTLFPIGQEDEEKGGYDYVYQKDAPVTMKSCAVFAAHSFDRTIPAYVVYYLKELRQVVDGIVFISDNRLQSLYEIKKIEDYVLYAEFSENGSSALGAWKRGIRFLSRIGMLAGLDELVLANDLCYGPIYGFSDVFAQMRAKECDYWSLLETPISESHLQSSFFVFNKNIIRDGAFRMFFDRIPEKAVSEYDGEVLEKRLRAALNQKYASDCYIRCKESEALATVSGDFSQAFEPLSLMESGFPLLFINGSGERSGRDFHKVLSFIRKHNETLYTAVTEDLHRRLKEKNLSEQDRIADYWRIVATVSTVSFDVFDTLLIRAFDKATDVFRYIETVYDLPGFAQARVEAERIARNNKRIRTGSEEVTIEDIYAVIIPKYREIKEIELDTERTLIEANPMIKSLYDHAERCGKQIIATSDMYLPKDFIEELLKRNGYDHIEKVFVSSEHDHNKGSGELYTEVIDCLKCSEKEIVHFGDNFESDVVCAKKVGINAFQIRRIDEYGTGSSANRKYAEFRKRHEKETAVSIYIAQISKFFSQLDPERPFYSLLGYTLGGCLALSYMNFVCEEAVKNNADHLMFAARDGFSLMDVYKEFFYEKYRIPYSYVYLNRNVVLGVLDGIPEEPRYLYSMLKLARKSIPAIIVSEDNEKNIREYKKHEEDIEAWKEKNRAILYAHLENAAGNAEQICVVDMTTGQFSSLHGAKTVLGNRIAMGIFTGVFPVSTARMPYESFCRRKLNSQDELAIKFSELLLTSPEESIGGLDEQGRPIYDPKVESNREKRYYEIMAGIKDYCRDFAKRFRIDSRLLMSFEQWIDLIDCYCQYCSKADKYYLNDVVESPDPDVNRVKNNLVKLIEERQKTGSL